MFRRGDRRGYSFRQNSSRFLCKLGIGNLPLSGGHVPPYIHGPKGTERYAMKR